MLKSLLLVEDLKASKWGTVLPRTFIDTFAARVPLISALDSAAGAAG